MCKSLLYVFCFLNLVILHQAEEYYDGDEDYSSNGHTYDLNALLSKSLSRMQSTATFKDDFLDFRNLFDFRINDTDFKFDFDVHVNLSRCMEDVFYILTHIKEEWAKRMIDSIGKPESGLLQGNFKWVGDYNECLKVRSTNENSTITIGDYTIGNTTIGKFRGKYCSLSSSFPNASVPISISLGVCVPDTCSEAELNYVFEFLVNVTGHGPRPNGTEPDFKATFACKPTERQLNTDAIAVIVLISVFCVLTVLASSITAAKYFKKVIKASKESSLIVNICESEQVIGAGNNPKIARAESDGEALLQDDEDCNQTNGFLDKLQTFLGCFCVFTNGAKLLTTDSSEGQLLCIHGIRFLSMSWVILGHAYMFCFAEVGNILEAAELLGNFPFQVVLQGFYSVDSFFVLSGFLLAYLAMKEFSRTKGVISWPYFYIHRYIRLTPVYMVILGFSATVYRYLGSGPFWPDGDYDKLCRKSWWWNLLYINNFNAMSEQCMGWSWYLANDMQFFVISPIFLITLWRWPKIGYSLIAVFLLGCFVANFSITYDNDLPPGLTAMVGSGGIQNSEELLLKYNMFFDKIYIKPYTRIGPYLVGILVGYLLFRRNAVSKPKHSLAFICIGWIVATSVTLACVYGLYHAQPTVLASSFYNALNRTLFGMGLSWVIYVCLIGQGGVVNSILSYKLFIPLSRLTYAAYLIHPMIVTGYYAALKKSFEFTHASVVSLFLGFMVLTYGLALPVALILESPIVSLEKLVRKSFSKKEAS